MTMDKLFDGSDAHLLPGNAELIQRLRTHACYTAFPKPVSEAADAIEAADKRIAELERKLAVAAEALDIATTYSMLEIDRKVIVEALAQIGGGE